LNYFQLPVSFGTVFFFWNHQGLLSRIQLHTGPSTGPKSFLVPFGLAETISRVRDYFYTGVPVGFVPWDLLDLQSLSEFQIQVYQMAAQVPHGETRTYGAIAKALGKVSASRAVGQALKKNPFPILVPCHRVVNAHGTGGFLGELDPSHAFPQVKRTLIALEEEYLNPVFSFLPGMMRQADYTKASVFSSKN
jgi:methylated-DNA-[protein]-cysteine S-methyltransferase